MNHKKRVRCDTEVSKTFVAFFRLPYNVYGFEKVEDIDEDAGHPECDNYTAGNLDKIF